jgi:hypothetical protein
LDAATGTNTRPLLCYYSQIYDDDDDDGDDDDDDDDDGGGGGGDDEYTNLCLCFLLFLFIYSSLFVSFSILSLLFTMNSA